MQPNPFSLPELIYYAHFLLYVESAGAQWLTVNVKLLKDGIFKRITGCKLLLNLKVATRTVPQFSHVPVARANWRTEHSPGSTQQCNRRLQFTVTQQLIYAHHAILAASTKLIYRLKKKIPELFCNTNRWSSMDFSKVASNGKGCCSFGNCRSVASNRLTSDAISAHLLESSSCKCTEYIFNRRKWGYLRHAKDLIPV